MSLLFNRLAFLVKFEQENGSQYYKELEQFIDLHIPPNSPTALAFVKANVHLLDELEDKFHIKLDVEYSDAEDCAIHLEITGNTVASVTHILDHIASVFDQALQKHGYEIIAFGLQSQHVKASLDYEEPKDHRMLN